MYDYIMFHKPSGCITARRDERHKTIMDYLPEEIRDTHFPVGRLDKDTEGLLLITNDGRLTRKLLMPEHKVEKTYYFMAEGEMLGHRLFSKKYPAHLHIDILDVCQGQGVGTRLMNELKAHLKNKGVPALMLSCGGNNTQAVKFYKKNNFKVIKNLAGSYIMGIDL